MPQQPPRRSDGARTHAVVLGAATRIASTEGIEGLTIGRLAAEVGISKSGVYAHFGSREHLQAETVAAAQVIFEREVLRPAGEAAEGRSRLEAICLGYLSYVERRVFPGGCFFAALLAEMDARSGPIHDLVVEGERNWQDGLAAEIRIAQETGELSTDADAEQISFELQACLELTNYHFVLFREHSVIARGRRTVAAILDRALSGG